MRVSQKNQKLSQEFARKMLRELPGFRTVAPSHGDVIKVAGWLLAFKASTVTRKPRKKVR